MTKVKSVSPSSVTNTSPLVRSSSSLGQYWYKGQIFGSSLSIHDFWASDQDLLRQSFSDGWYEYHPWQRNIFCWHVLSSSMLEAIPLCEKENKNSSLILRGSDIKNEVPEQSYRKWSTLSNWKFHENIFRCLHDLFHSIFIVTRNFSSETGGIQEQGHLWIRSSASKRISTTSRHAPWMTKGRFAWSPQICNGHYRITSSKPNSFYGR